jgi:hypothetical protein
MTLLIDGIRPGGVGVQSSSSPMRIIIGADGFQRRSSLADGGEPLNEAGRHIRGYVRRRKQGAAASTTRSAPHRPGAVLGRAASHRASPRTPWRRGPGPRVPKPSCRRTGGQILPAESPHWPSWGGKGNSAAVESHDAGCLRVSLGQYQRGVEGHAVPARRAHARREYRLPEESRAAPGMWPSRDRRLFSATFALQSMTAPRDMLRHVEVLLLLPPRSLLGGQSHCKGRARF